MCVSAHISRYELEHIPALYHVTLDITVLKLREFEAVDYSVYLSNARIDLGSC